MMPEIYPERVGLRVICVIHVVIITQDGVDDVQPFLFVEGTG
jgi:hypothetical protein